MRGLSKKHKPATSQRNAFTLVEMLVSVTLVLLMMGLFASIFQIATGSMTKQRGISEQDQRARILATNVRKDLQHRTFRYLYPFCPEENSLTSPTSFANRTGYFYISTNNPHTGLDDVIQFTVNANITTEDADTTPFFGRAVELVDRSTSGTSPTSLHINPNQPEADDGSFAANSGASSPYAEICYFVRNGNLYRRVILIREPLNVAGQNLVSQPTSRSGYNYLSGQPDRTDVTTYDGLFKVTNGSFIADGGGGTLSNDFQLLFDHAAFASFSGSNQSAVVLGVDALSNETTGAASEVLANPARRWGFNPLTKRSREHSRIATATLPSVFIGRYTHAETSSLNFNFPQNSCRVETIPPNSTAADSNTVLGNGNPMDVVNTPVTINANGVVAEFDSAASEGRGGIRRVEDLLLANVHEMKVELWDQRLQRFVVPGHSSGNFATGEVGDYHLSRCHNPIWSNFGGQPGSRIRHVAPVGGWI
jgi:type II secretory pathway pseudopilin PulG